MTTSIAPSPIDVRSLAPEARAAALFQAFDRLAPGESLLLVTERAPAELLASLQAERKGAFEWSPLQAGALCFRTEVARRQAAERGTLREVSEALAWDHDRLDALEQRAFGLLAGGDAPGARHAWADFECGLRRHIRFEEELLFPTFEQKLGMPAERGPTAVMRMEHREIEALLESIGQAFAGGRVDLSLRTSLHDVLGQHNEKEEHMLYPSTDQCLEPGERDALVARIQAK